MSFTSQLTTIAAAGAGGQKYWIFTYWGTTVGKDTPIFNVNFDSSNNYYGVGYTTNYTAYYCPILVKLNENGEVQFSQVYNYGNYALFRKCAVDDNGNVYAFGWGWGLVSGSGSVQNALVAKINSSGVTQWARGRVLYTSSAYHNSVVDNDRSNISYNSTTDAVLATWWSNSPNYNYMADSVEFVGASGTETGNLANYTGGGGFKSVGCFTDSSGYRYVLGVDIDATYDYLTYDKASNTNFYLPVFRYKYEVSTTNMYPYAATDDASYVYICGEVASYGWVMKIEKSTGTRQWSVRLGNTTATWKSFCSIAVDPTSGDVWALSNYSSGTTPRLFKFLSNGQQAGYYEISCPTSIAGGGGRVTIDKNGNIVFSGYIIDVNSTSDGGIVIKLPSDLSVSGTFGSYTITAYGSFTTASQTISGPTAVAIPYFSDPQLQSASPSPTSATFSYSSNLAIL